MRFRLIIAGLSLLLLVTAVWAKGAKAPSPLELMARSDAQYYYPSEHGVTDLVVEMVIEGDGIDPAVRDARVSYFYAGLGKSGFAVENIPVERAALRPAIRNIVEPLEDYLMPKTSIQTFAGMQVSARTVSRLITGLQGSRFDQIIGTRQLPDGTMSEVRILLDADGLARQIENYLNGQLVGQGAIENVRIGAQWHCAKLTSPVVAGSGVLYHTVTIDYTEVDGIILPSRVSIGFLDQFGRVATDAIGITITLRNYRINQDASAAFIQRAVPAP